MQASEESGAEQLEIVPLVIVTQAFPIRPSSLPEIRDFVRRRLTPTTLSEDDVRQLCERVAAALLEAAGGIGTIQVSLRIFPGCAEVDVLFAAPEADPPSQARGINSAAAQPAERIRAVPPVAAPVAYAGPPSRALAPSSFADWLAAALRREGMTLEAAARHLGVSVKTVSRWVGGTTEPRLRDLSRIRDLFGEIPFP